MIQILNFLALDARDFRIITLVQNHITEAVHHPDLPPSEQKIDGIVEMHFEDRAAMDAALSSLEAKAMFADGTLFIETVTSFVVDPKVVIGE